MHKEKGLLLANESQLSLFGAVEKNVRISKKTDLKANAFIWQIYTDGASRGNPGAAGAGVYIFDGEQEVASEGFYLGNKTNNQAEYLALLLALWVANKKSEENNLNPEFIIISDSELMVRQMNGIYKVKNESLLALKNLACEMLKGKKYKLKHVLRHNNLKADNLANQGINKKQKIPTAFVKFLAHYNIFIATL
jgi:ribonuclease HI